MLHYNQASHYSANSAICNANQLNFAIICVFILMSVYGILCVTINRL